MYQVEYKGYSSNKVGSISYNVISMPRVPPVFASTAARVVYPPDNILGISSFISCMLC